MKRIIRLWVVLGAALLLSACCSTDMGGSCGTTNLTTVGCCSTCDTCNAGSGNTWY